jgi:hypothetical protein
VQTLHVVLMHHPVAKLEGWDPYTIDYLTARSGILILKLNCSLGMNPSLLLLLRKTTLTFQTLVDVESISDFLHWIIETFDQCSESLSTTPLVRRKSSARSLPDTVHR